jgi:hypothetical protein
MSVKAIATISVGRIFEARQLLQSISEDLRMAVAAEPAHGEYLDSRELSTVLAALRLWQRSNHLGSNADPGLFDIATNGDTLDPLSADEIDALCERINTTGETR